MKRAIIVILLLMATILTSQAQIKLGSDFKQARFAANDPKIKQAFYNDTFTVVTYMVPESMEDSLIDHVFAQQRYYTLGNGLYFLLSEDLCTYTLFSNRTWTKMVLHTTRPTGHYMYDKIWWFVDQVRCANGEMTFSN